MAKKIAAFFDIDGTLVRESIQIKHFKKLVKYGLIDKKLWMDNIKPKYEAFDKRVGGFDDYIKEVSEIYRDRMQGINYCLVDTTAQQVIDEGAQMVYRYTRDRIKYHKKNGHLVFFISGSPNFLVGKLGEKYEIDGYQGTEYIFDEKGNFSGDIIPMWDSKSKLKKLNELVREYDLDPDQCFAYGDTNGDFSMLKFVGRPVAINPSKKLLKMLKDDEELSSKVRVVVERKDVIYDLDPGVKTLDID